MRYCPQCGELLIRKGSEYFCPICGLVHENMELVWSYTLRNAPLPDKEHTILQDEIEIIANQMNLPKEVAKEAKRLARKIRRVNEITPMACALLYVALRKYKLPFTFKDFTDFAPLHRIINAYKKLGIKVDPPTDKELAIRFANHLGLPPDLVLEMLNALDLENRAPRLRATIAVYAVLKKLYRKPYGFIDKLHSISKYHPKIIWRCYRKCSKHLEDIKLPYTRQDIQKLSVTSPVISTVTLSSKKQKYRARN